MRLIDADAFIEEYKRYGTNSFDFVREIVKKMPTIEPRKHGRWEYETRKLSNGYGWYDALVCTVCYRSAPSKYRYCPNCGSPMDEVEEETLEVWDLDGSPTRYIKAKMDEVGE